jgi:hypothetical protein
LYSKVGSHHAEGQFNPNAMKKKKELNLDTPEHVDSGNMNPMHDICGCHDGIDMENTPQFHSTTNFPK